MIKKIVSISTKASQKQAAIFIEDAMTNTVTMKLRSLVYVPEGTTEFHAHEAARFH